MTTPVEGDRMCRCGHLKRFHRLANYADGPHVGEAVLVCPVFVFEEATPLQCECGPPPAQVEPETREQAKERMCSYHWMQTSWYRAKAMK